MSDFWADLQAWTQAQFERLVRVNLRRRRQWSTDDINRLLRDRLSKRLPAKLGKRIPPEFLRNNGRLPAPPEPGCPIFHGLYLTDAYTIDGVTDRFSERTADGYRGVWLADNAIDQLLLDARVKLVSDADLHNAIIAQNYGTSDAGINFRQSTRFSGPMRKYVQVYAGAGIKIPWAFSWDSTVGFVGGWMVKISSDGIFRQPATLCSDTSALGCEDDAISRYIPAASDVDEAWEEIAGPSAVEAFYDKFSYGSCCGWAFDSTGLNARNTCHEPVLAIGVDPDLGRYTQWSYLYEISLAMTDDGPAFVSLSLIEDGEVLGVPDILYNNGGNAQGNYFIPEDYDTLNKVTAFADVEAYSSLGGWFGETYAPIYTYYDDAAETWKTYYWLNYQVSGITGISAPVSFGTCGIGNLFSSGELNEEKLGEFTSSVTLPVHFFGPVFSTKTNPVKADLKASDTSLTSQTVWKVWDSGIVGSAAILSGTRLAYGGDIHLFIATREILSGIENRYLQNGKIPLFDREAMQLFTCIRQKVTSGSATVAVQLMTDAASSYDFLNSWGHAPTCEGYDISIPATESNDNGCCGGSSITVRTGLGYSTPGAPTTTWVLPTFVAPGAIGECEEVALRSPSLLYPGANILALIPTRDWDSTSFNGPCGPSNIECACSANATLSHPSYHIERTFELEGSGGLHSAKTTETFDEDVTGFPYVTPYELIPSMWVPGLVLRNAFHESGALYDDRRETAAFEPDPKALSAAGSGGPHEILTMASYSDAPDGVYLVRRPVYVGVPDVC